MNRPVERCKDRGALLVRFRRCDIRPPVDACRPLLPQNSSLLSFTPASPPALAKVWRPWWPYGAWRALARRRFPRFSLGGVPRRAQGAGPRLASPPYARAPWGELPSTLGIHPIFSQQTMPAAPPSPWRLTSNCSEAPGARRLLACFQPRRLS